MSPWGYKAYVPIGKWLEPSPVITKFSPGHDYRILSNSSSNEQDTIPIELHFSQEMNCDNIRNSITVESTTSDGSTASLDNSSVDCSSTFDMEAIVSRYTGPVTGQIPSVWVVKAKLVNVSDGVHSITVSNGTNQAGNAFTNVSDLTSIATVMATLKILSPSTIFFSALGSRTILSFFQGAGTIRTLSYTRATAGACTSLTRLQVPTGSATRKYLFQSFLSHLRLHVVEDH